ncbi:MAG TPA: DnaJ domain-containing protein [Hyphomicrobiaceae bacterium]|nr:DnaJ domain-containing protein [Hyphomicrobiaceae bacterium]
MNAFVLGVIALLVVLAALGWFPRANTVIVARNIRIIAGVAALGGGLLLLLRGSASLALPLAALGIWLIWGQKGSSWAWPGGGQSASGRVSKVVTDHLEMELDHDTGEMRGRVLKGFFANRQIQTLRPVELAHLWQDCRFVDPQSAQLVEAYLDRIHPSWREDMARQDAESPKGPDGKMTREEALEILGLTTAATEDDIRHAHRDLMLKVHPDRGGSTYLAAKINEAKNVALAGIGKS